MAAVQSAVGTPPLAELLIDARPGPAEADWAQAVGSLGDDGSRVEAPAPTVPATA
jgi:hypothetical protein